MHWIEKWIIGAEGEGDYKFETAEIFDCELDSHHLREYSWLAEVCQKSCKKGHINVLCNRPLQDFVQIRHSTLGSLSLEIRRRRLVEFQQ